jgi:hypothetical protein
VSVATNRPFRGRDAIEARILTRAQLRSSKWRRLFQGIYVASDVPVTHILRCEAVALRLPAGAVITGRSAAEIWGVRVADPYDPVEVLTPRQIRAVEGVHARIGTIDKAERRQRRSSPIPVPTAVHTAWEIARALPATEAVPWIDALARVQEIDNARLRSHADAHAGVDGNARAQRTLLLCDGRAESPPESVLRLNIVLAGLPAPVPQWRVVVNRQFLARVDLAWPDLKLAVEYDGEWHASNAALSRDRQRLRDLQAAGWYVYPVTRHDMRNMPQLIATIASLIAARSSAQ